MLVTLTRAECDYAASIGVERHLNSLLAGHSPNYDMPDDQGWRGHIEGAAGEHAVANFLGVSWDAGINTFAGPDIGTGWQVRTRSKHHWDLIVRESDNNSHWFILVTGEIPAFNVVGYIQAQAAKRREWFKTFDHRPKAYFVPQSALTLYR